MERKIFAEMNNIKFIIEFIIIFLLSLLHLDKQATYHFASITFTNRIYAEARL